MTMFVADLPQSNKGISVKVREDLLLIQRIFPLYISTAISYRNHRKKISIAKSIKDTTGRNDPFHIHDGCFSVLPLNLKLVMLPRLYASYPWHFWPRRHGIFLN